MRKSFTAVISALLLVGVAVWGFAGIGPDRGLPPVNTNQTSDNNLYQAGDDNVVNNKGSVMCVACHTRNPSYYTAYRVSAGVGFVGSHWVTKTFNDTSEGGGYETVPTTGGKDVQRTTRTALPIYMASTTPSNWSAAPRYGYMNSAKVDNAINPTTIAAQIVCESCHNIILNVGANKLLARGGANDNSALCVGCHGDMDPFTAAEYQLHPITVNWGGTAHHRNSHSTASDSFYTGTMSGYTGYTAQRTAAQHEMGTMSRAYYGDNTTVSGKLIQLWAANYGSVGSSARNITCDNSISPRMINGCPDNGQIRMGLNANRTNVTGDTTGAGFLQCTNCHRAHNATSSAGATILMSGTDNTTRIGSSANPSGATDAWVGTARMSDRGGRASAFNTTNPLCLACHK